MKKQYAYLQTILKVPVKFEKDRPNTVGGIAGRRYIFPIHFCSIRARKKSKIKMKKKCDKKLMVGALTGGHSKFQRV